MGKFATYQKRGSCVEFGTMPAAVVGDWLLLTPIAATLRITRTSGIPAPAGQMGVHTRLTSGGAWSTPVTSAAGSIDIGATTGLNYSVQIAWFDPTGTKQLSAWSDTKTATPT